MANITIIGGIDPGRIHTGCVAIVIDDSNQLINVHYRVIPGIEATVRDKTYKTVDVIAAARWVDQRIFDALFTEDYNPGNYAREDKKMSESLGRMKVQFPPSDDPIVRYVDNAGINTLIPVEVQKLWGVHKFPVSTHHNDLNSAGKIALLGMLQDKGGVLRELLSRPVRDQLNGNPWVVNQHG